MLLRYIIIVLTASGTLLWCQTPLECDLHLDINQPVPSEIHITLRHDRNCKITMDENDSRITITAVDISQNDNRQDRSKATPDTNTTEAIIALAMSKLGNSYQPSQAGPDHFDCSGFVYYLFRENGIAIPRSSLTQSKAGTKLNRKEIVRGDILFFDTANRKHINHSGIYLGHGKFIHSSSGHAYGVTISDLDKGFYKEKFRWGIQKK